MTAPSEKEGAVFRNVHIFDYYFPFICVIMLSNYANKLEFILLTPYLAPRTCEGGG